MGWLVVGAVLGAAAVWWAMAQRRAEGTAGDEAAVPASGGAACPRPAAAEPAVRRVLVRVPAACSEPEETGGDKSDGAWPATVPPAFRPEAFVDALDAAADRHGVRVPYSVDCGEFPCMVILEEPLAPEDNDAVMAWANALHNPGGIPDADMHMFSNAKYTVFFIYPGDRRRDEPFQLRLEQRAREIMEAAEE
ncbi:MAG: hypothetical protein D6705_17075 [Deltaproteobacteria bacterium]|nr:MAG: hypothetical protein D6705_17075 [Deltaproteobacteria bacterium]